MENKIEELDVKMLCFTEIKKEIITSFQHLEDMKKIVEFNEQNNYIYAITNGDDNDLLSSEVICYLINKDYVITSRYTNKKVEFKHKKLIEREEKERAEIKGKRGF